MNVIPPQSSSSSPKAEDDRRLHNEAQDEKADSSSEGEDEEERKQRQEEMLVKSFDSVRPNPMSRRQRFTCASKGGCSADEEVKTEHHNTKIYRKSLTFASLVFDMCCSLITQPSIYLFIKRLISCRECLENALCNHRRHP